MDTAGKVAIAFFSFLFFTGYYAFYYTGFLSFSDAAKFADIARNIIGGNGYASGFSFFSKEALVSNQLNPAAFTPPAMPYSIAFFFKLFGISDASVIATSFTFFLLTVVVVYLLGKKMFGKTVGALSAMAVMVNQNFLDYAKNGASETLFMLETVTIPYLFLLDRRWSSRLAFLLMVLMYFTRPQAFVFIAGYILFYLLLRFKPKKALMTFVVVIFLGLMVDNLILSPLNGKYFLYSVTERGAHAITQHSPYVAASDVVRGVGKQPASVLLTLKKTGTNLFNFYRSLPQIVNPYLMAFFALSPFVVFRNKREKAFLIAVFFTATLSFLLPALTIPFYRYVHPALPLVYLVGIASLVSVLRRLLPRKYGGGYYPAMFSFVLVSIFVLIVQVGVYVHDYKYYQVRRNYGKAPVYVQLAWKLKEISAPEDVIVTNLDTWGSWYGERKTIWFPLEPEMLDIEGISVDAIYLTNYLIDDENYHMGEAWRDVFFNPESHDNEYISDNYEFVGEYHIEPDENYEKMDGRAVLFARKDPIL